MRKPARDRVEHAETDRLLDWIMDSLFTAIDDDEQVIELDSLVSEHHDPLGEITMRSALKCLQGRLQGRLSAYTRNLPKPAKRKVLARTFDVCHTCGKLLPAGRKEVCAPCGEAIRAKLAVCNG